MSTKTFQPHKFWKTLNRLAYTGKKSLTVKNIFPENFVRIAMGFVYGRK